MRLDLSARCDEPAFLVDQDLLRAWFEKMALAIGMHIVKDGIHIHPFDNGALAGMAIIEESHMYAETWPEYEWMAFEISSCRDFDAHQAAFITRRHFDLDDSEYTIDPNWGKVPGRRSVHASANNTD